MPTKHVFNPTVPVSYVTWTRYIQAAGLTILLYDHLLTFQEEVDFVWRGTHTRSWPRMLFFAARYTPVVALIMNMTGIFNIRHSIEVVIGFCFMGGRGFAFLLQSKEVISQMRLWAVYRSRKVLVVNGIVIILGLVAMGTVEGLGYRNLQVNNMPGMQNICGPRSLPHYVYAFWIPPIIIETISVLLVIYKAIRYYQEGTPREWGGSRFMRAITRYSVAYFVVVLVVYVANFYIWFKLPVPAYELLVPLTFALPSIAGNRMLLSLRAIFYTERALTPGKEGIGLKIIHENDRGVVIQAHEPYNEFESFFGENKSVKERFLPSFGLAASPRFSYPTSERTLSIM